MQTIRETLLIFMRFPELGKVKSRLGAAFGAEGALALYTRLARRTLGVAADFKRLRPGVHIHVFFTPSGRKDDFARFYPGPWDFVPQEGGHLGERMERAFLRAWERGLGHAVMVGADIADLAAADIEEAFEALESQGAALGPASDGGFYLIGLKRPCGSIFGYERWGEGDVFRRTRDGLLRSGLSLHVVRERSDIDRPEDVLRLGGASFQSSSRSDRPPSLTPSAKTPNSTAGVGTEGGAAGWSIVPDSTAEARGGRGEFPDGLTAGPRLFRSRLSVVIPTLGPPERLRPLLDILEAGLWPGDSIIAVLGVKDCDGSEIRLPADSPGSRTRWISAPMGRGVQMNAGAREADGDVLWFLHGDSTPPPQFAYHVRKILDAPRASLGCFRLAFFPSTPLLDAIASWANFRTRRMKLPYGDQGFFCRRETFEALGGFGKRFIMEDVDFVQRARKTGKLLLLPETVHTSSGRYLEKGVLRTSLQNHLLMFLHFLGVDDRKIHSIYYKARGPNDEKHGDRIGQGAGPGDVERDGGRLVFGRRDGGSPGAQPDGRVEACPEPQGKGL